MKENFTIPPSYKI